MMELSESIYKNTGTVSTVAITPRLHYSLSIINDVINLVELELQKTQSFTRNNFAKYAEKIPNSHLEREKTLLLVYFSLLQIQKRVKSIRGVYEVPEALLFSIPVIRFLSSSLFNLIPHVSKRLCELSINLGSMTVDSATITGANFDLKVATRQSSNFLDEVKLMVDSKISKLYPNLESVKPDPT